MLERIWILEVQQGCLKCRTREMENKKREEQESDGERENKKAKEQENGDERMRK